MRESTWSILLLCAASCGGSTSPSQSEPQANQNEPSPAETTGDEVVPPPEVADLVGAAEAPPEPDVPADTIALTSRMQPRRLHIPAVRRGRAERFVFDGHHRGWFARTPAGRQALLTPVYGDGKIFVGGGFGSHQLYAFDARTGERQWTASAPDGGPSAAILEDDKVLFNTESCTLFAVDAATGRRRWSRWLGDPLMSQPAAANGLVFSGHIVDGESPGNVTPGTTGFGTGDGRRYAFTALNLSNGAPRWTRPIDGDVMNAAVLDGDDVFFTTMRGTVYRMDQRSGRVRWRRRLHATSAPWLERDEVHVTVRLREGGSTREKAVILARDDGETEHELDPVDAAFAGRRPDPDVQNGWAYEGSRATVAEGRIYQTIGNEVHCRDADTRELLWRRQYTDNARTRAASPPAIAGSQLVFGTRDGVLFGLDIDTGMTAWAYDVGEPISAQPTIGHGWVYASTTRGGVVALEVSDVSFDGWHMWGGNAAHNGRVMATEPPDDADGRPSEGTLSLGSNARDGEIAGFPLQSTEVEATVSGFVARVSVEQTFANPYARPVEAVYLFPLPDDAAVDGMELRTGDRVVRANIQRREQAQAEYREARQSGVLASLLEQERPNLFRQSVANIRPGDEVRVRIEYTQALPYEAGSYRFVYPMVAGPRYEAENAAGEPTSGGSGMRQVVLTPGGERPDRVSVRISADLGMDVAEVTSPTHRIDTERDGRRLAIELAEAARPDRDLDVRFRVAGAAPTISVLTSAPQEGEGDGEAASAGHFSLALHPQLDVQDEEVMPRELVFVVDTSSSMHGRPIALAQAAMRTALGGLRPTDTFRVHSFSDTTSALSDAPLPATPENIQRAQQFVDSMRALGATEMIRGIRAALDPPEEDDRMRVVLLMTDGFIGNESEIFREVNERLGHARVFGFGVGSAVNRYLLTRVAEVGRGDVQVVTLDESPAEAARTFHERIARPFLTDIQIDWGELDVHGAYPRRVPDLYADRPLVVHGRYGHGGEGQITLRGRIAGRAYEQTVEIALPERGDSRPELESLWARTRIRDLMTAMSLRPNADLQEEITQLGLQHHLLTEWTAFIAVDQTYRVEGESQTVQQPSETPAGITAPPPAATRPRRRARTSGGTASARSLSSRSVAGDMLVDPYGGGYLGGGGFGSGGGRSGRPSPGADLGGLRGRGSESAATGAARSRPAEPSRAPDVARPATDPPLEHRIERRVERGDASEAGPAARPRRQGRPNCRELATRPDGTIDAQALEDCLRRQREGAARKAGGFADGAPKSEHDGALRARPIVWRERRRSVL